MHDKADRERNIEDEPAEDRPVDLGAEGGSKGKPRPASSGRAGG
jgi:hypothetical protein